MSPRAAVAIVFALNGVLYGAWAARIPAVSHRLDLGAGELGIALAFIAAGALIAMPIAGRAANRFGSAPVTTVTLVLLCAGTALAPAAPSLALLCAACMLLGGSGGALDVSMNAQGVAIEARAGRPILSSFHAAFSAGGLLGALLGAAGAATDVDARAELAVLSALALVIGVAATRALLPATADAMGKRPKRADGRRGSPDRRLVLLGVLGFCCLLCEGAAADWSAVYVDRSLAATAAVAGLAYAAFSVAMVAGRLVGDALTERFGAPALVRGGALVAAAGLAVALLVGTPGAALAGFAALGAGLSIVVPQVFRAAAATGDSGPALATVSTFAYTGFLAGPPLIGGIAELTSLPLALGLLPLLALAMAALAPLTRATPASSASRAHEPVHA
jgi:MFS family permease